jgi:glycosyltransferase involved in cell wall biosynthesis
MSLHKDVVIYLEDAPRRGGSGAHLRFFSNVRGWCDAGAVVHLVRLVRGTDGEWRGDGDLPLASMRVVRIEQAEGQRSSILARLAYRLGIPTPGAVRMYFPAAHSISDIFAETAARLPGALHVMEGELLAAAVMHHHESWIWSEHESLDTSVSALHAALPAAERSMRRRALAREQRFAAAVQRRILRRAVGVIYINERSQMQAGDGGHDSTRTFLPLSVADDDALWAEPSESSKEPLRLLHLGSVTHLPTYSSLRFLLGDVFPQLPAEALARIRLTVVGRFDETHPRCQEIARLALPFPHVEFTGFASSLEAVYAAHDAQIVASTEGAGIRTRVVESLARGLPVIASPLAVEGMPGLIAGEHYIPFRDVVEATQRLSRLAEDRSALVAVAAGGRTLYLSRYSRRAVRDGIRQAFGQLFTAMSVRSAEIDARSPGR